MKQQDLADALVKLDQAAGKLDEVSKLMLSAIKAKKVKTVEAFNELVSGAYEKNGWSRKAGRPALNATEKPAPDVVQLYVSSVRAAYRSGLDVLSFETVGGLRKAVKEKRASNRSAEPDAKHPELKGLKVTKENRLTGALWHDAVVVWEHLPSEKQTEFESQVRKLIGRFSKTLVGSLKAG